ncbi:hypothetical protein CEXT_414081 [Caerostris extrusa]|uniref:Uncharacterized protein n=1 Tax=Caerostris extrusa TaxID=172846 RepID=A0AAV4VIU1_CAEEX|nr:hypothetical protein CEXT_414081 [Caerostris extrusa]
MGMNQQVTRVIDFFGEIYWVIQKATFKPSTHTNELSIDPSHSLAGSSDRSTFQDSPLNGQCHDHNLFSVFDMETLSALRSCIHCLRLLPQSVMFQSVRYIVYDIIVFDKVIGFQIGSERQEMTEVELRALFTKIFPADKKPSVYWACFLARCRVVIWPRHGAVYDTPVSGSPAVRTRSFAMSKWQQVFKKVVVFSCCGHEEVFLVRDFTTACPSGIVMGYRL